MDKEITQLKDNGFYLLKNVFSPSQIEEWRTQLVEYMSDKKNRCKNENGITVKPDAINYPEFKSHLKIFENLTLINFLKEAVGGTLKYAHHYDLHLGCQASTLHHDGGIRHMNQIFKYPRQKGWDDRKLRAYIKEKYNITYKELCGTDSWKEYANPRNEFNHKTLIRGEEMLAYRVGIYLQDNTKGGGLYVLKGSHKKHASDCSKVYVASEIGDVVIWDSRAWHAGEHHPNPNRGLIHMAFGKPNFLLDMYAEGHSNRLKNQNGADKYILSEDLKQVLNEMEILY